MPDDHPSPWSMAAGRHPGWAPPPSYAPEPPRLPAYGEPGPAFVAPRPIEVRLLGQVGAGRGLAITGVVLGGLALLVALIAVAAALLAGVGGDAGGSYGLRGTVSPVKGSLTGAALAQEVSRKVAEDGGAPEDLVCPGTVQVAQDVTAVCHGSDYGDPATFVVFFEDDRGAYTLLEV